MTIRNTPFRLIDNRMTIKKLEIVTALEDYGDLDTTSCARASTSSSSFSKTSVKSVPAPVGSKAKA